MSARGNADEIAKSPPSKWPSSAYAASQRPRFEKLVKQPLFIKNGELRDFQLTGFELDGVLVAAQ